MLKQTRLVVFTLTVVALLVASTFLPASAQLSQWRSLNPYRDGTLPISGTTAPPFLYSVHLLSANYGWAVGGDCDIYTLPVAALAATFAPACQSLPGKGFALFYDGAKWRNVLVPGATGTLTAVFAVSTADVWAVGLGPTIIHWDGMAWTLVPAPAGLTDLFGLFMLPGGTDGWAVGDGAVDNIRWSGTFPAGAWSAGPTPNLKAAAVLRAVSLSSPTFGWIVASDGGIFKWDGAGWTLQISPVAKDLLSVNAVSSTDAWAVGAGSTIIRWNGASWTGPMVAPTVGIDYRSIKMVSATDGWIAGALNLVTVEGLLLRWNGVAWNIVRSFVTQDLNGLFMLPGGTNGSAVGDAETIIYWTNVQWISQTSPTAFPLFDVHMVSTNDGWAVGGPFLLLPSTELATSEYGGSGWSVSSSPITIANSSTTVTSADTQTTTSSQAVVWTDKSDYSPGDAPTIYGSGFNAIAEITVSVIRPDDTIDTWSTISSDLGSFTTIYVLDGIRGLYTVRASDGTNTATTTFTDGIKSVQCDNGPGPAKAACTWITGTLNAPTAYAEGDSVAYSVWIDSLAPSSSGNTVVIEYDFTKQTPGGLIVLGFDFLTHPDSSEDAVSTRCSGIPGGTSVPNCAGMGSPGATLSIPSDPFTFSTSGVNAPLNGQSVAAREAAYSLSHPTPAREPVIFGGSITAISVPSKIGDPNTAASRSQITITFSVGSFNSNSCASATSCAVNILVGAHIAQGTPAPAGWGLDRGASDFPGSSLATSIDGGSRSIAPPGIKSSPTIATVLSSASITVGGSVFDTATLSGATSDAGGTVTYYYYSGGTCSGTGTQVGSPVTVTNGIVPNSGLQQFNSVGSFSWNAVYSGDSKNNGATSDCEPLTINKATPTIGTELSSTSITAGSSVTDSATLTGATGNAGGTVTYNVYSGGSCSGGTIDTDGPVTVTNGIVPTSKSFTFPNVGTFSFQAVYSGDANNNGATSDCSTELLFVGSNPMDISTSLSQYSINVGGSVTDSATLSGSTVGTAGGTVTFSVFSGPACGGPALDTDTKNVASGNVPDSKSFTFNSAGTFSFLALYSGDANHNGATSICSTEILTVNKLSPTIATVLSSASITVGGSVFDTATLSGATSDAGGTVTYYYYSGGTCSGTGTQVGSPVTVTNGIVPNSGLQQFNSVGSFSWNAVYSGDSKNNGATSDCKPLAVTKAPSLGMMGSSIFHWTNSSIFHWFHYETLPSPNTLLGVFMLNTNDGWIVGNAANPTSPPVILHWNGVAWVVKTPPGIALGGTLMDVHALTPTEAWAVGFGPNFGATSAPPIVRWDGTIWASVPSGLPSGVLTDLHMLSSTDGWAVGCTVIGCGPGTAVILHWNGLAWSSVTAPLGIAGLLDVFMLSPTDGWAVGNIAADGQGSIIHWDGVQWRRVPAPTGAFLTSVHMVSANDGWTVGFDAVSDLSLIVHWNGLTWDVVSTPPVPPTMTNILTSVFMVSALDGWAVSGFTFAPNAPGFGAGSGLFIHYGPEVIPETTTSFSTSIVTETSTATSVITTSTITCTTCTIPPGPGIPGYPIESILAGLIAGVAALAMLRHRPRRQH